MIILTIKILNEMNYEHFKIMMLLEKEYYSEEFITPVDEAYNWYKKFPNTTVAATDGERIVGFVNLFPIKKEIFELILVGKFNDQNLTLNHIESFNSERFNMFLSCIVVKKEYRKMGLAKKLLQSAVMQYESISDRCDWIIVDNVTEEGERFSEKYGFSFVCHSTHNSKVYIQPYKDFVLQLL